MTTETDDKKNILTVGFTDSQREMLDSFNADRFNLTHVSAAKAGIEEVSNEKTYHTLILKESSWPGEDGRSALDGLDILSHMISVPKLILESVCCGMLVGIAYPKRGETPTVQNLDDIDRIKRLENVTTLHIEEETSDLMALFNTVVPSTVDKTTEKEDPVLHPSQY